MNDLKETILKGRLIDREPPALGGGEVFRIEASRDEQGRVLTVVCTVKQTHGPVLLVITMFDVGEKRLGRRRRVH